jgi:hypothetical protein
MPACGCRRWVVPVSGTKLLSPDRDLPPDAWRTRTPLLIYDQYLSFSDRQTRAAGPDPSLRSRKDRVTCRGLGQAIHIGIPGVGKHRDYAFIKIRWSRFTAPDDQPRAHCP